MTWKRRLPPWRAARVYLVASGGERHAVGLEEGIARVVDEPDPNHAQDQRHDVQDRLDLETGRGEMLSSFTSSRTSLGITGQS